MDFYETERRRGFRAVAQPMCFDNTACFDAEVQSDSNGAGWQPRFADRSSSGHQLANAFHFNDNQSSTGTTYSLRPEGHIYEEVGPPTQPPPYFFASGEMDGRIPSVHQAMDHHHHMRGSPSSLCSMCSRHCTTGNRGQPSPPSLPICNLAPHGMQQPFCNGSIPQHPIHASRTLSNGHNNPAQQCSPTCTMHGSPAMNDQLHHGTPCNVHPHNTMAGVSNQRYTAAGGTITPDTTLHNSQVETSSKPKDRSLSPFAFLRKNNRDSKALSTNTMLDSSSNKSVLMCSRRWLIAIALTLVVIVVLSVAVGLVVTFTVQGAGEEVTSSIASNQPPVERLTSRIKGSLRVVGGSNSVYSRALSQPLSPEYKNYTRSFTYQTNEVLNRRLSQVVDYTEVQQLSNGSVIVDFIIHLKNDMGESKAKTYAKLIKEQLYLESNTTKESSFKQHFPVDVQSIKVKPLFEGFETTEKTTTAAVTTAPPTTTSTTTTPATTVNPYTIPPASGVCEPITNQVCEKTHYNKSGTTFPNFVGQNNQEEAEVLITVLNAIMATTSCYDYLNTFSCALLAPKCGEDHARIPPCKRLCEAAFTHCGMYISAVNTQISMTNCSWFPNSQDPNVCVDEQGPVVPTAVPTCPPKYFSCDDLMCHEEKDRCDSVRDCADGVDELNCENFECVAGQFQCGNGNCRPKVWKCDGRDDCGDGSDEEGCEPVAPCEHGEYKCTDGFNAWNGNAEAEGDVCVDAKFTCDGTNDCSDGSDEDDVFCRDRH